MSVIPKDFRFNGKQRIRKIARAYFGGARINVPFI
jgi:hypothetical protein